MSPDDPRLLLLARQIALVAHHGQTRRNGEPYFNHVERVSFAAGKGLGIEGAIVGYLHDVVEDTDVTHDMLWTFFPSTVAFDVDALTRDGEIGETYPEFIRRINTLGSSVALQVKLCDLFDNMTDGGKGPRKRYVLADQAIRAELNKRGVTPFEFGHKVTA